MRRRSAVLLMTAALTGGCFDDVSDIQQFMVEVDARTVRGIEPIPEVKEFAHVKYSGVNSRSPFARPKPEAIEQNLAALQDCLHPDPKRVKEPLEKYSLSNLKMKGTLGYAEDPWALIESATDGSLHRVSIGNHMGLFNGKITEVSEDKVHLLELIPDGTGCYKERVTIVDMNEVQSEDDGKNSE